ncbi:Ribosomal large subunit pseudouridine synthase D [Bacteroidales bacterium Barb4]|nr:Ribosomal large subunit pseudouridine synthase D [Bacteroidales bacterium Barb4]
MGKRFAKKEYNQSRQPRERRVTATEPALLLPFLFGILNNQSKSSVKAMLKHRQISVNGKVMAQFDLPLSANDVVGISYERGKAEFSHPQLAIVWEDDYLIVVNKREGLLSVASIKEKERTVYNLLSAYVKKTDERNKIFVLHRLDRDTSGLMLFAKNKGTQEAFQSAWTRFVKEQVFVAVTEGCPNKASGLLTFSPAVDERDRLMIVSEYEGENAVARYTLLRSNEHYALLELRSESGRRNQMRAQLKHIGRPIAGDLRYGAETDLGGRLMLHAQKIAFVHPDTGAEMVFEEPMPRMFMDVVKSHPLSK